MKRKMTVTMLAMVLLSTVGVTPYDVNVQYFHPREADLTRPPADVPFELRVPNWVKYGSGSCYHASTHVALRWADQGAIADNWRRTYGSGASTSDIARVLTYYGIPYKRTQIKGSGPNEDGDEAFLNYAHNRRLVAAIHYFRGHAVSFLGWAQKDGKDYAVLLDNNRIEDFIFIPKQEFLRRWQTEFHGGAIIPLVNPPPPKPYNPRDQLVEANREW